VVAYSAMATVRTLGLLLDQELAGRAYTGDQSEVCPKC